MKDGAVWLLGFLPESTLEVLNSLFLILNNGGGLAVKLCLTLATPWTVACQNPLSMGFSRQEYWSGLPLPSPGDLPDPGIETGVSCIAGNTGCYTRWEAGMDV